MLDPNLLNKYLELYPLGMAGQRRLEFLLQNAENSNSLLKQAIDQKVSPDVLMPALQKGIVQGRNPEAQGVKKAEDGDEEDEETKAQRVAPPIVEKPSGKPTKKSFNLFRWLLKMVIGKEKSESAPRQKGVPVTNRIRGAFTNNWKIIGGVLLALLIIGILWYFGVFDALTHINITPAPLSVPAPIQTLGHPKAHISVTSIIFWLAVLTIAALLEAVARGESLPVDFFAPVGLVATLIFGQIYGHDAPWFWALLGASLLGMAISTFYNPSEEGNPRWWDRFDTTHWYVAGAALIFICLGKPDIYPSYLPIVFPILVTILALGKEYFRQLGFSLIATAIGIYPAIVQTPTWIALGLAAEVILAVFAHQQGWVTMRQTTHPVQIPTAIPVVGGRGLTIIIAWDLVLFYIIEVAIIGYLLYGNYVIAVSR